MQLLVLYWNTTKMPRQEKLAFFHSCHLFPRVRGKFGHKSYPIETWWAVVVRTLSSYLHFQLKKSCSLFPGKASGQFGKLDDRSKRGQKHAT